MTTTYEQQQQRLKPNIGEDQQQHSDNDNAKNVNNCTVTIITDDDSSDADTIKEGNDNKTEDRLFACFTSKNELRNEESGGNGGYLKQRGSFMRRSFGGGEADSIDTHDVGKPPSGNRNTYSGHNNNNTNSALSNGSIRGSSRQLSSGSNSGCVPILLTVPDALDAPRRRHSWICGYVFSSIDCVPFTLWPV